LPPVQFHRRVIGARHWHAVDSFLFDWSLYHATDKAVKSAWAGDTWSRAELSSRMQRTKSQLELLARPAKTLAPGEYRAYLAPAAVDELLWMLNWGGVSTKSQRTKQSCLQRLVDGEVELSPQIALSEQTVGGLAPAFDEAGFSKPDAVELIVGGRHAGRAACTKCSRLRSSFSRRIPVIPRPPCCAPGALPSETAFRYAIKSCRSFASLIPENVMLVPGSSFSGLTSHRSSVASVHTTSACFRASE